MSNFWKEIANTHKPFFCLAPMEDVTDIAFREMFARYSKQSKDSNLVLFTEFTPSDGLAFGDENAQKRLRAKLSYTESQRPIVAQIYNSDPSRMRDAAALVQGLGFDGVDINMGCPVNAVVKQVSGAALIKHPDLAVELIRAVREGAPRVAVSVKTRIGYSSKDEMQEWLSTILREKPDALTVHLRTRSQFSRVPADWSLMSEIIKLRDEISSETIIIGNGDVQSVEQGKILAHKYGCEGIMVGRGAFGTPDFFVGTVSTGKDAKIKMLIEHIELFDEMLLEPEHKGYHVMKKHFKAYINGWSNAKELRVKLMNTQSTDEAIQILRDVV